MTCAATPLVPSTLFETTNFHPRDQFDAWREHISVVFNVDPIENPTANGFLAMAVGFHLGDLVLARTRFDAQRFVRTTRHARSDMLDHYLVQLYTEGGYTGEVDGNPIEVLPGTVSILDLAHTTETRASAAECISLVIPRDTMVPLLPSGVNLHGLVLDSGHSRLFSSYLLSLVRQLPTTEYRQAPLIARATCNLLAACLMPKVRELRSERGGHFDLHPRPVRRSRNAMPRTPLDAEDVPLHGDNLDEWIRSLRP